MYPTNSFGSSTYRNVSSNSSAATSLFDTNLIPAGGYAMVLSVILANKSGTARNINMTLQKAGSVNPAYLLYNVSIPSQTSFELMEGNKFVLGRGDTLRAWVDADGTDLVDAVVSYVIYSPAA